MMTAQERILGMIELKAQMENFEVAQSVQYANTGLLLIYEERGNTAVATIDYNFQTDLYTLSLNVLGMSIPSQVGRDDYFDFHQRYDHPTRFWAVLKEQLEYLRSTKNKR